MSVVARHWVPAAAVVPQERGPEYLGVVDGADWTDGHGFYRGFFASFFIKPGKDVWFHWPLPTPVEQAGRPLFLDSVSLLWETDGSAKIGWMTLQHGGLERVPLTERMTAPPSVDMPHPIAEEDRKYFPVSHRRCTEIEVRPRLSLRFGIQLCVMVSGSPAGGVVRFHGAGVAISDAQ